MSRMTTDEPRRQDQGGPCRGCARGRRAGRTVRSQLLAGTLLVVCLAVDWNHQLALTAIAAAAGSSLLEQFVRRLLERWP